MNFFLYEMAKNTDIQEKARQNIKDVVGKYDGKLSYDCLSEMSYLNMCINGN